MEHGPALEIPERMNVATFFVDRNVEQGRGARTAIYSGDREISYAELLEQVNRAGSALRGLDVRLENRVLLLMLDEPEFAYAFFGAIKIGAVPVPTNTLLKPRDYEYILNDSRARVLIVSAALRTQIEAVRPQLKHLRQIIVVGQRVHVI